MNWYKKSQNQVEEQIREQIIGGRDVFEVDGLQYMLPSHALDDQVWEIGVNELENGWQKDKGFYLGKKHSDQRSVEFSEWMEKGIPIETPEINVGEDGTVYFTNGRHRFIKVRGMGKSRTIISVPQEQDTKIMLQMGARRLK